MKAAENRLPDPVEAAPSINIGNLGAAVRQIRHVTWMLAVMIALNIMSQFYRSSNGVIAPELMADLGIDAGDIGWSSGSFFFIFALLQIPIGVLFDRYGVRRVVSSMLIFAVIGSLLFAFAQSVGPMIAGRFLIGLGFAGG